MVTVLLSHEVKDFQTWKTGFDNGEALRAAAGVTTNAVYTAVDNPNMVTVSTDFPSAEAVQGFMNNPQLAADMETAGVISRPDVKILQKL